MANFRLVSFLFAAVVAVQSARPNKPGLLSGTHSLGMVMPQLSGWGSGWNIPTTTVAPDTTTGWSVVETTTTIPDTTTTGWSIETTPGWSIETTTPAPVETTTGWSITEAPTTTAPGWSPPSGWTPPAGWAPSPPVNIEMLGESAVVGEGESGATHGSETAVSGDSTNPAVAIINTGSYSSLGQGSGVLQIGGVNSNGESNTFQGIDGYNFGDSGEYYGGSLSGNQINTLNGGGSFVLGQGAIGQGGFTLNNNALPLGMPFRN